MCWMRFFAVRVPGRNNARLLTGGRRAAREESFDYYSVAGDPARGMRRGGARAGAPDPRTGGAVPRRRASVPTGLLCVIKRHSH
jgi:hypothetical protein